MKSITSEIDSFFNNELQISQVIDNYHFREEQLDLANQVAHCFINDEYLVAEAGTGIGKTLAYLLPAVLWSVKEGHRVVISTRTKALQQQIIEKDIPALQKLLAYKFLAVEAKGRENYLCWNKYMSIMGGRKALSEEEQEFIAAIMVWAEKTKSGDRKELSLPGSLMKQWPFVAADRHSCRKDLCRYQDKCFRLHLIRQMEKAHLIITNHALLLSDLMAENNILPEYKYLIIDEAHNFDRESFDKLSCRFSYDDTLMALESLYSHSARYEKGYLQLIKGRYPEWTALIFETGLLIDKSIALTQKIFSQLNRFSPGEGEYARVIKSTELDEPEFLTTLEYYRDWQSNHNLIIKQLNKLKEELSGKDEEGELASYVRLLYELSEQAFLIMEEDINLTDRIIWLEYSHGQVSTICSSLVKIGDTLQEKLYQQLDSLIMVSATLTVEEQFDYFINKIGLTEARQDSRINTCLKPSPFAYDDNACLCLIPEISSTDSYKFNNDICEILTNIILTGQGKSLVLFTSRKQMQQVAQLMRPLCQQYACPLFVQYEDGESGTVLNGFIEASHALLMGVDTFWEGIDLKGNLLNCIVMVKLPFRPPSEPFSYASDLFCQLKRQNGFKHFLLPDAAVRFKQGIGRLIRGEADRGLVVLLDNRIINMPYGKVFINSSPIKNLVTVNKGELQELYLSWL